MALLALETWKNGPSGEGGKRHKELKWGKAVGDGWAVLCLDLGLARTKTM